MASMSRDMMAKLIPLLAKMSDDVETASGFAQFLIRSGGHLAKPRRVRS